MPGRPAERRGGARRAWGIGGTQTLCHRAQAMIDDGKLDLLQEMYHTWPFFSVTLDMVEMVGP